MANSLPLSGQRSQILGQRSLNPRLLSHRCSKVDIGHLLKHNEKRQCATWRLTSGALCSRYFMFCESSSGAPGPLALASQVLISALESIESTLVTTPSATGRPPSAYNWHPGMGEAPSTTCFHRYYGCQDLSSLFRMVRSC